MLTPNASSSNSNSSSSSVVRSDYEDEDDDEDEKTCDDPPSLPSIGRQEVETTIMTILMSTAERSMPISDHQLVERCRSGDLEAFGQVYARYERPVFRYAFYLLGHEDDAADVKQETFLRAYHRIAGFRGEAVLLTWLLKICVNLCRDRLRLRERRNVSLDVTFRAMPLNDAGIDPAEAAERAETVRTILRALGGMPEPLREMIVLHEIEGLECGEIARVLGCTAASARMRLYRARRTLKDRVESLLGEDR